MMKKKQKILVIDFNGTSPTYTHYFTLGLASSGMEVEILGFKNPSYLNDFNKLSTYIGINIGNKHINYILNWIYLIFIARKYAVLHFQWFPLMAFNSFELILIKYLKLTNNNLFYTIHNFFPHNCQDEKIKNRYLSLYRLIDNLIVHTSSTYAKLEKYGILSNDKNVILINHGYFYSEFYESNKKNQNGINFLMLGRISEYKGYRDAFILVKKMTQLGMNVKLHIQGKCDDHAYFNDLKEDVRRYELDEMVILENKFIECEDLIQKYNESTFCLMPYREIEQSGVLFTSIGLRVPVIGYEVGGLRDEIHDGKNGYLVNIGNVDELYSATILALKGHVEMVDYINSSVKKNLWRQNGEILKKHYFREYTI